MTIYFIFEYYFEKFIVEIYVMLLFYTFWIADMILIRILLKKTFFTKMYYYDDIRNIFRFSVIFSSFRKQF